MALNFGSAEPSAYYLGSNNVNEIYFGDVKVWPTSVFGTEKIYIDPSSSISYIWPTSSNSQNNIFNISPNTTGSVGMVIEALRYSITSSTIIVQDVVPTAGRVIKFGNYRFAGNSDSNFLYENSAGTSFGTYSNIFTGSRWSYEMWVKPYLKTGSINGVTTKGASPIFGNATYFTLAIGNPDANDGSLYLWNRNSNVGTVTQSAVTPQNVVTYNQWNHVIMTMQGTGSTAQIANPTASINLYVNGQQVAVNSGSNPMGSVFKFNGNYSGFQIGKGNVTTGSTNNITTHWALMDSSIIRMYNKVLTSNEVLDLFDNTKARYGFNEYTGSTIEIDPATYTGGSTINNSITSNPMTFNIVGPVQYTSSLAGGVFNFAKTNTNDSNYIEYPNSYDFGPQATFMTWVYPKGALPGGDIQILLANTTNYNQSNGFKLMWDPYFADANAMSFENGDGTNGAPYNTTTGSVIDNQWQHLTWTYNKTTSTVKIYRNGQLRPYLNPSGPGDYVVNNFNTNMKFIIGSCYDYGLSPIYAPILAVPNKGFQMNAYLGVMKITNVELPASTILDDFNATRARYGV